MDKELFNEALQVEQLEERFEMTTIAADAERCGNHEDFWYEDDFGVTIPGL